MSKKLQASKSEKWISQGAPKEALEFLGNTVTQLNDIAVEKQIVFKGNDEMDNNEVVNTEEVKTETPVTETVTETVTKEVPDTNVFEVIQKGIVDSITVALKEYNDSVIAPLQAQIAELKASLATPQDAVKKGFNFENVFIGANEFMPSAAVAAMMKKEFNLSNAKSEVASGDVVVEPQKVETVVVKKEVTTPVDKSNVLAGF